MENLKMKDILIRIVAVLILGIIIWNFIAYLSVTFMGLEFSPFKRFISALLTTVLTVTLLQVALKMDKLTWNQIGQTTVRTNIFSFLLGFFLWTIPASIGFFCENKSNLRSLNNTI
ncbi:hypothetical protein, partial [Ureibacillus massiliensis]|uniref:hypothetical protein n=1 Tax=Ureibacillus massiliensis TaxID=292806 RepID=UPI001B80189E